MATTYATDAIVIRSREYSETDRIITLFSRERGKIAAVAKGVRRPQSKQRGGTQLFTYADFLLRSGRSLDTVVQAQPREAFMYLWNDPEKSLAGQSMLELLDISTLDGVPDSELFTLTLTSLFYLAETEPFLLQAAYALRLLRSQGHLPELKVCTICGTALQGVLLGRDGAAYCYPCAGERPGSRLSPGSLATWRSLGTLPLTRLGRLRWSPGTAREILTALQNLAEQRLERRLKAWKMAITGF
jgi:DNA repair protein RecO (recombination protein O)